MSENISTKIKQKLEIPKLQLWIIWAIMFLLPSILSLICFKYFQKEYIYFLKTDLIDSSFERLRNYNDSIIPENFIKNRLELIKGLNTNKPFEQLKSDIDQILCSETHLCMFFDEAYNKAVTIKSPKASITSINFLKTSIVKYLKTISSNSDEQGIKKSQEQLASRLQSLFKTPTPITLNFDNVSINFSVINEGELYFFLIKFNKPTKDCSCLFSVIKGKDFSFHKMLNTLHNSFPESRIVFKEININNTMNEELSDKVLPAIYSGLKEDKNNFYILAPANLRFIRHILHGGTAELNPNYGNLFPFIEFHIPIEKEINNLKQIESKIRYISLLFSLISAIYFLYLSLFGLNPYWKFKSKIIVLTIISSIVPFSIFTLGIYSLEKFNRFMSKISIEHHTDIRLQINNFELENYLTKLEYDLNKYSYKISSYLENQNLKADDFSKLLSQIADVIPLSKELIFLDSVPDNLETLISSDEKDTIINIIPERTSKETLDEQNQAILTKIPSAVLKYANEEHVENREAKDYFILAGQRINSSDINTSMLNAGNFNPLYSQEIVCWYIMNQLHKNNSSKLLGVFCAIFEPRPILSFFYKNSYLGKKKGFCEQKDNYEINYAFLPIENSGNAKIWTGSGKISNEDKEICLRYSQSGQLHLKNKTIITKLNQRVPHLAVAIIKELNQSNDIVFIIKTIFGIFLYLLLIVYFSNKLLDSIFIEPVMLLASTASSIAKGGEEWNTEIKSGDEFEELNNSLKNLVTGLKERNLLKNYVSEDAFSDIKNSDSLKLSPGGEYMEATIVFSALKDYEKLSMQLTPQESIDLLSKFMSIAEESARQYGGSIDKIIGDTIMLVFRDNSAKTSHGLRAAQAALKIVEKAKSANLPKLFTGIASGKVISGRIGSYSGKLDFTVIGNPVNLAARFKTESKNGTEETGIIISGTTIGLTKGRAIVKYLRRVSIKGKAHQYNIYELLGIRD